MSPRPVRPPKPSPDLFAALLPLPDGEPAYLALARGIRLMVLDGRLAPGMLLPPERTLAASLGFSRTTITSAYRELIARGWASARQGSGTLVRLPAGDRAPSRQAGVINLSAAAGPAPAGTAALIEKALEWLPRSLSGSGYEYVGAPHLRERIAGWYEARGVPTSPDQVLVTPGAVAALNVALHTLASGGAVAVDDPTYKDVFGASAVVGADLLAVPLGEDGWDLDAWAAALRSSPSVAYLVPDFLNPTGLLVPDDQRKGLAALLNRAGTVAIVDESLVGLDLDGGTPVTAWAALDPEAISLGSLSKVLWGGVRIGWLRAPERLLPALAERAGQLSLGPSALDQLVATTYLEDPGAILPGLLDRFREARDTWLDELDWLLPDWQPNKPRGGLALWVDLGQPKAVALAAAAWAHGLELAPGPRFSATGGSADRLRLPLAVPPELIPEAVSRLADAWQSALEA